LHAPGWEIDRNDQGRADPELPRRVSDYWAGVGALTGMTFPSPLHYAHVCTDLAGRVVKAAERQDRQATGEGPSDRLLRRMRESWFVFGRPADTVGRGLAVAAGVDGLDVDRLAQDVEDPAVEAAYRANWEEARRPNEHARSLPDKRVGYGAAQPAGDRMRFGLPCMILTGPAREVTVSGWRDWATWESALHTVDPGIVRDARPLPTPAEAFATWPVLARPELEVLCGPDAVLPSDAVAHEWPGGVVWLTADEAAVRLPTGYPEKSSAGRVDRARSGS